MVKHTRKIVLAVAALVALALGGATLAQAGNAPSKPAQIKHAKVHVKAHAKTKAHAKAKTRAAQAGAGDTDHVQSGDQSAPDTPGAAEAPEGTNEASGSEVPNNDGPGGHADEPGNPTADHQFQGEE